MERSFARTALLVCLASALFACANGPLDGTPLGSNSTALELARLPVGSKVYFRRLVSIPARSGHIRILYPPETPAFAIELTLQPAEVDRVIKTTTPLMLERIVGAAAPGAHDRCDATLFLRTSGGETMQMRIGPLVTGRGCRPPTVADIAEITIIVPAPPVPIH